MSGNILSARSNPYKSAPAVLDSANIYDASCLYNYSSPNTEYTIDRYRDNTENFKFFPATSTYAGRSDFDNLMPWKGIRRCNLEPDGTISAYEGDPNFTLNPTTGDVMVEIPKFWYGIKPTTSRNEILFTISNVEREGFYVSPRHQKFGDMENDFDYIYIGAYPSTTGGRSLSGAEPIQESGYFNTYEARKDVPGFYQMDYLSLLTLTLLMMIESSNLSLLPFHSMSDTFTIPSTVNGLTDQLSYHTGYIDGSSWKYRGIENLSASTYAYSPIGYCEKDGYTYISTDPAYQITTQITTSDIKMKIASTGSYVSQYLAQGVDLTHEIVKDHTGDYFDWKVIFTSKLGNPEGYWPIGGPTGSDNYRIGSDNLGKVMNCCRFGNKLSLLTRGMMYHPRNKDIITDYNSSYSNTVHTRLMYLPPEK